MSFFDDKNEVLNIELTPYGKYLLSKGKFKPHYYAFFDDSVIYDSEYMGLTEEQNAIQERILNQTPTTKLQRAYTSAEENVKVNDLVSINDSRLLKIVEQQIESDKNYSLALPVGRSSNSSLYYPSWDIKCLNGTIKSTSQYIDNSDGTSGSLQPYLKIPQLNMADSFYNINIVKNNITQEQYEFYIGEVVNEDDTYYILLRDSFILLDIAEQNTENLKQNFEIEVFVEEEKEVFGKEEKQKFWKQLNFLKEKEYIKNNILLEESTVLDPSLIDPSDDPTLVDHYFNLLVDEEIILPPQQMIKYNLFKSAYGSSVVNTDTEDPSGDKC